MSIANERWETLTIADDFVFCKAMLNAELCKEVLEAILGVPIERVEYVRRQEQLDTAPDAKSVRLDVVVKDGKGTVYNVEMQSVNTHELPQRSRYYHAMIALDQLQQGDPYKALGNAYVIFICNFDLFKRGQRVYWFENTCQGMNDLALNDGAKTIFLAANAPKGDKGNDRLNELLDYISSGKVTGDLSTKLATEVANVLDNQKWRLEYMWLEVRDQLNFDRGEQIGLEKGMARGLAEGLEKGMAQGMAEGLEKGLAEGESKFAGLISALVADNRLDDVQRVATDLELRQELYRHYGLA